MPVWVACRGSLLTARPNTCGLQGELFRWHSGDDASDVATSGSQMVAWRSRAPVWVACDPIVNGRPGNWCDYLRFDRQAELSI